MEETKEVFSYLRGDLDLDLGRRLAVLSTWTS